MNKRLVCPIIFVLLIVTTQLFGQIRSLAIPEPPPSENILNAMLTQSDLPAGFVEHGEPNTSKLLAWGGWMTSKKLFGAGAMIQNWVDVNPGLIHGWKKDNRVFMYIKYGYFNSDQEATEGTKRVIPCIAPSFIDHIEQGSFSGRLIGNSCFRWEASLEKQKGGLYSAGDDVCIAFSKGRYATMIRVCSEDVSIGSLKGLVSIEDVATKCENKIALAYGIDSIRLFNLRPSLQSKLNTFIKNYQKGKYKTALNDINAFINELKAQRGKKDSEAEYQTLKDYADTIVQSLNALM